jgi:hypothetical protein
MYPPYCFRLQRFSVRSRLDQPVVYSGEKREGFEADDPREAGFSRLWRERLVNCGNGPRITNYNDVPECPQFEPFVTEKIRAVGLPTTFHELLTIVRNHALFAELTGRKNIRAFHIESSELSKAILQVSSILDTIIAAVRYLEMLERSHDQALLPHSLRVPDSAAGYDRAAQYLSGECTSSSVARPNTIGSVSSEIVSSNNYRERADTDHHPSRQVGFHNASRSILHNWFMMHFDHPYPSEKEKRELVRQSGLTLRQVNDYFANKRMRCRRRAESLRRQGIAPDYASPHLADLWSTPSSEHFSREESGRGASWRARVLPYAASLSPFLKDQPFL